MAYLKGSRVTGLSPKPLDVKGFTQSASEDLGDRLYSEHEVLLADAYKIVGDVTISDNLILTKLSDDGNAITVTGDATTTRTISGSGSLEGSTFAQTPNASMTGMTGVVGSAVTGGAGLTGSTSLGTVTAGTLGTGVTGGSGLDALSASNLSAGTVPDARFPATLPAASGVNLTALPAANITGVLPVGVTGGTGIDKPKVVWAGWNGTTATSSGVYLNWPLDVHVISLDTAYMTKSTNTFTCVKAGTYFVSFNTMSSMVEPQYVHHRMMRNGVHFIQTHGYTGKTSIGWKDFGWQVMIDVSASQYLTFTTWAVSGVTHPYHGGSSYSQLSISYMHA